MTRDLEYAAQRADAIVGVTDEFVSWGLSSAKRCARPFDRAFAMGYSRRMPRSEEIDSAHHRWCARGLAPKPGEFIVCFFGTLGWMFDFDTVVKAARRLREIAPEVTFVVCGTGDRLERIRRRADGLPNFVLPGYVGASDIWALMRRSAAGLAPYRLFKNFHNNLPNKPIEYLAAGLPIIATRLNVLSNVIDRNGCGLTYADGDDQGLIEAVLRLLQTPTLRCDMARRAEALHRNEFDADGVYDTMASHLEQLARSRVTARVPSVMLGHTAGGE